MAKRNIPPKDTQGDMAGLAFFAGGQTETVLAANSVVSLPRNVIEPWAEQPRKFFAEEEIAALARQFERHGFKGTLVVRPHPDKADHYQIIDGERSWRAAGQAGIDALPCLIAPLDDNTALELAIAKNHFREDLTILELTESLIQLMAKRFTALQTNDYKPEGPTDVPKFLRRHMHPRKLERAKDGTIIPQDTRQSLVMDVLKSVEIPYSTFFSRHLAMLDLPDFLKNAHLEHNISYNSILEVNKLTPRGKDTTTAEMRHARGQQEKLVEAILAEDLSFREVKERVKELQQKAQPQLSQGATEVRQRFVSAWKQVDKSDIWQDKDRRAKLQDMTAQLEALLQS